ncbi:diacylglycerol kinase family lipid kinase [Paenibacillus sp. BR2-3]|uniref:diacylglycerol/lipid kinase family protein n=1 Tax=Paenibacillus sp. BR2-3 TaxID=3048494 RepID=UPI0039772EA3
MYLFIINRRSGGGAGVRTWHKVEGLLQDRQVRYETLFTHSAEEAEASVLEALQQHEEWNAAVVIGGDGTIHSILGALKRSGVPLAVIPAGSGNDTARGFGIPLEPRAALEAALGERCFSADLLSGAGTLTLTAVASGFDAQVAENVNASRYKRLCNAIGAGQLAYIIGILHTLITFKPCRVSVVCDGKEHTYDKAWLVSVCNLPSYGGGLLICPQAEAGDGQLDVCVVHGCSRGQLLRLFPTVLKGRHVSLPFVSMLRGRSAAVRFAEARHAIGDGESLGAEALAVRCEPGALRVLSPLASSAALPGADAAASSQVSGG